jgi:cation diffusion facilitator CzcD-associated flavoprotein CzcO
MSIFERAAKANLKRQVPDPELRSKLEPSYRLGCKRILYSDTYLPALTRPNVEVVTAPIREVRPHSIVTADGAEREVDTIVFGTGFHVSDQPLIDRVRGRDGRLLADHWHGTMAAFNGTTITGFPNLFVLLGPYTGLGHTSIVIMIEAQIEYVMKALDAIDAQRGAALDVRPQAQAAFVAEMNGKAEGTVWTAGGCQSWYLDAHGNASAIWPDFTFRFRSRTKRFDTGDYDLIPRTPTTGDPAPATAVPTEADPMPVTTTDEALTA